jgi:hypothetical protein
MEFFKPGKACQRDTRRAAAAFAEMPCGASVRNGRGPSPRAPMRLLLALLAVAGALLNTSAGVAVVAAAGHANVVEPAHQLLHCDAATGAGAQIAVSDVVECIARSSPTNIAFVHPTLRTPTVRLDCKCVRPACATPVGMVGGPSADYECPKENLEAKQEETRKAAAKAAENVARQQAEASRKAAEHAARRAVSSAWTDRVANVEEEMNRGPDHSSYLQPRAASRALESESESGLRNEAASQRLGTRQAQVSFAHLARGSPKFQLDHCLPQGAG